MLGVCVITLVTVSCFTILVYLFTNMLLSLPYKTNLHYWAHYFHLNHSQQGSYEAQVLNDAGYYMGKINVTGQKCVYCGHVEEAEYVSTKKCMITSPQIYISEAQAWVKNEKKIY